MVWTTALTASEPTPNVLAVRTLVLLSITTLAVSGCLDSKIVSDFDVELAPRFPVNESPLADATLLLTVRTANALVVSVERLTTTCLVA